MDVGPWPNLFIIGAAKSGTTSLSYYLSQHPDVFMAAMKEPHFFSRVRPEGKFAHAMPVISDQADYLRLFAEGTGFRYRGEASTSYLWSPEAAGRIAECVPEARIIAILREPIERLHSHYLNDMREGIEDRPIDRAIEEDFRAQGRWGVTHLYVECGFYSRQLERYLAAFPRHQLLVLFLDDLRDRVRPTLRRVFAFLDLDLAPADTIDTTPKNTYAAPRNGLVRRLRASPLARGLYRGLIPPGPRMTIRERLMFRRAEKPSIPARPPGFVHELYREELARFPQGFAPHPHWLNLLEPQSA